MRRREFIVLMGAATAWPLAARAQQPALPVVGFLRSTPAAPFAHLVTAFRKGLSETGFVEGQNVAIEYRWANNQLDHLPSLAADLVRRQVAAIVSNGLAVQAAQAATTTIPIVFVAGDDPVRSGLVTSLGRPGGNVTGVTFFAGSALDEKRLELLHELAPKGAPIAVLLDPNYALGENTLLNVEAAGRVLGREIMAVKVASERDFDAAFTKIVQAGAGALLVSGSPFFTSHRRALVALAAHHAVPASYDLRDFVEAGGLISYGASLSGAYRHAGNYVGRILKGEKPANLPVQQSTTFELAINLSAAKALGITIPPSLLVRTDEVIE
jgi:putative ABC transport system substrate-binding protein